MKSLSVNGAELCYLDRGAGLPLVLVHGFPLDHTMWAGQIEALVSEKATDAFPPQQPEARSSRIGPPPLPIRVIAPDLRGFGRSGGKADKVTMEQFADDLAGLLDGLRIGEPVVLCGLSMGGYVVLQFWRKYATRLRAMILCDTRAAADTPEAAAARHAMAQRVLREGPAPLAATMLPRLLAETTRQRQPRLGDDLRKVVAAGDPHGIAAAARGMAERPDMTAALSRIGCPTLLIVGQEDAISPPAEMRGMAAAIPGASFVEIARAGHMAPLENPAEVNAAILAFLAGVRE